MLKSLRELLGGVHYKVALARERRALQPRAARLAQLAPAGTEPRVAWEAVRAEPLFSAVQVESEIVELLDRLAADPPATVLEIGGCRGGTMFLFSRVSRPDATLVTLDIGFTEERVQVLPALSLPGQVAHGLAADSRAPETLEAVKSIVGGGVDFLFIDGDHSYDGVRSDFVTYAPLVRRGGIVGLHDIVLDHGQRHGRPTGCWTGGVPALWAELKVVYPEAEELIDDPEQDGFGIGLIPWEGELRL